MTSPALRSSIVHATLVIAYGALAVLHTYPLIRHLDTHLPGAGLGDNVSFAWNLWWMREALASPEWTFFTCPLIVAPLGGPLVLHTHTALTAFLAATVLGSWSIIEAQNLLLIASLALNGIAGYLLAWTVTRARWPSIVAGALFLLTPAVTARLMGHYNLIVAWPLLFACAAFVRWWQRPGWRWAIVFGLLAGLVPFADYYHAVFLVLFVAVYSATELWSAQLHASRRPRQAPFVALAILAGLAALVAMAIALSSRTELRIGSMAISMRTPTNALTAAWVLTAAAALARWRIGVAVSRRAPTHPPLSIPSVAAAFIVFLLVVMPLVSPAWDLWRSGGYVTQASALRSSPRGVDLATMLLGPPYAGTVGSLVRDVYGEVGIDPIESSAWVGVAALVVLIVGFRRRTWDREERRWMTMAVVFGVWALGPYLIVLGSNTGLLLPQAAARLIPVINNARIPGRAMVMVAASVTVLVAFALVRITTVRARSRWFLGALAAIALVESLAAPLPLVRLPDAGVYREIGSRGTSGAVLTLPFGMRDGFGEKGLLEHDALYGQTIHGHPLVGGFLARLPPQTWAWYESTEPFNTLLALSGPGDVNPTWPTCATAAAGLRAASVSYVVAYQRDIPERLRAFSQGRLPLRQIAEDRDRILFEVTACTDRTVSPSVADVSRATR